MMQPHSRLGHKQLYGSRGTLLVERIVFGAQRTLNLRHCRSSRTCAFSRAAWNFAMHLPHGFKLVVRAREERFPVLPDQEFWIEI